MNLIDKAALVAEIERRVNAYQKNFEKADNKIAKLSTDGRIQSLKAILSFINTLEVKEVDLNRELEDYIEKERAWIKDDMSVEYNNGDSFNHIYDLRELVKYFFELGLNTQQNINIDITNIDKVIEENGVDPNSKEAKMFKESYYIALEKLKAQKGE